MGALAVVRIKNSVQEFTMLCARICTYIRNIRKSLDFLRIPCYTDYSSSATDPQPDDCSTVQFINSHKQEPSKTRPLRGLLLRFLAVFVYFLQKCACRSSEFCTRFSFLHRVYPSQYIIYDRRLRLASPFLPLRSRGRSYESSTTPSCSACSTIVCDAPCRCLF